MHSVRAGVALTGLLLLISGGALARAALDLALFGAHRWRSVGPAATCGRVDDFAVARVPGQPDAIYVATASGGGLQEHEPGASWTPVFDRVDAMMSIGDVAVALDRRVFRVADRGSTTSDRLDVRRRREDGRGFEWGIAHRWREIDTADQYSFAAVIEERQRS